MPLLTSRDRGVAQAIAAIGYCNPFLKERVELERQALGRRFVDYRPVMHRQPGADPHATFPNVEALRQTAEVLADRMRAQLAGGAAADAEELVLYEDLVLYLLYSRLLTNFDGLAARHLAGVAGGRVTVWREFLAGHRRYLRLPGGDLPLRWEPAHAFAVLFQIQRAFAAVFEHVVGRSMPVARLRAAVWESVFTRDMSRYARALFRHMEDVPTLILGPSGTGKELVARAIGVSRYVPFDPRTETFRTEAADGFFPLNIAALSPTLVESELFGHARGAFTGAAAAREGWLEASGSGGTVFIDEIGELDPAVQVKLLRVLQARTFQRVGETKPRAFRGKFVTATNRDLVAAMRQGRFRDDLYYRLCADVVRTPSLREQLADAPEDLTAIVKHVADRVVPQAPEEAARLADDATAWIERRLGIAYAWPGNFRELEQCVRNVMVHGSYEPALGDREGEAVYGSAEELGRLVAEGRIGLRELTQRYASLAYARAGTYDAAGARIAVNWRTVRKHARDEYVSEYRGEISDRIN